MRITGARIEKSLTLMSIQEHIRSCLDHGRLHVHRPTDAGIAHVRIILLTPELREEIDAAVLDEHAGNRTGAFLADLDRFISGDLITIGDRRHKHAFLKRLDPQGDQVWELRSVDPRPSVRAFGTFADSDTLVLTHMRLRTDLGGYKSRPFRDEIRRTRQIWQGIFAPYRPVASDKVTDYVTENVLDWRDTR